MSSFQLKWLPCTDLSIYLHTEIRMIIIYSHHISCFVCYSFLLVSFWIWYEWIHLIDFVVNLWIEWTHLWSTFNKYNCWTVNGTFFGLFYYFDITFKKRCFFYSKMCQYLITRFYSFHSDRHEEEFFLFSEFYTVMK